MRRLPGLLYITIALLLILAATVPGPDRAGAGPAGADTIEVSKTAQRTQGCRAYEITLGITGEPPSGPPKVDVILVIDTSGSMANGTPRSAMYYAQESAKYFAGRVLQNTDSRVAVVSFDYQGHVGQSSPSGWLPGDYDRDSKVVRGFTNRINQVNNAINSLKADGGTNSEAGFRRAKELMQGLLPTYGGGREEVNRVIVFLTDGVPTVSIGNTYGPDDPTAHNNHTIAAYTEAQKSHGLGYQVFTINILSAIPTKCWPLARDTMGRSQNAGYYEVASASGLPAIYEQIEQKIQYSATNAVAVDTIPAAGFELVPGTFQCDSEAEVEYDENTGIITWTAGTITTGSTLRYIIRAKEEFEGGENVPTNEAAALTYTDLDGNIQTKDFPVPHVDVPGPLTVEAGPDRDLPPGGSIAIGANLEVSGGTEPYTYLWTCDRDPGWSSTEANPTVSPTADTTYTVTVTEAYGCSRTDTVKAKLMKGQITVNKVVQTGSAAKKFPIYVEGEGRTWCVLLAHGESAVIKGLRPGQYQVREVVPAGYRLVGITPNPVVISEAQPEGAATVTNLRRKPPGFHDEDEKKNVFRVIN